MAEDALVAKLFNHICESGGFVKLAVLLEPSSPLGKRKSMQEAKEWLTDHQSKAGFVCVKEQNEEITGVRIDLRTKLCHQYTVNGSCRRTQGKCKYWHVCKGYIEGTCDGKCGLSHNFHSADNQRKLKELGLEKHSSGTIRNNVAWSLPQVCRLYLRNKQCKSDQCPYLHVCSTVVQGSLCKCILSHKLSDLHNIKILKQYHLVPPHRVIYVNFVRCSILVPKEQKCIGTSKCVVCCPTVVLHEATSAVVNNEEQVNCSGTATEPGSKRNPPLTVTSVASQDKKQDNNSLKTKKADGRKITKETTLVNGKHGDGLLDDAQAPDVSTNPAREQDPHPNSRSVDSPVEKQDDRGVKSKVLFQCLCKEFNCSAPLTVLKNRKYVNEHQDVSLLLEGNKDKFLFTRNENDNIQDVIAFCPKLRLCFDFVFFNECKKENCPSFHLCRHFITGSCSHGETCPRSHNFRNRRDLETVMELDLDWLTNEQLRQLMLSSSLQVCISYNKGICTNDSTCSGVHICKDFVLNACKNGDACCFQHNKAFDTHHTRSLFEKFQVEKISQNDVLKTILVCEEQDSADTCSKKTVKIQDIQDSPTFSASSQHTKPSDSCNNHMRTCDEMFPSLISSGSVSSSFPAEWEVFECLCKNYGSSASFTEIVEETNLFPRGIKSAETWIREIKGSSVLFTEDNDGKIRQVNAFSEQARLCLDYGNNGKCDKQDCTYLHICRDYITDSCDSGVTCPLNHQFHNQRDIALLSRSKLDQFTDLQLQMLVLSSTPQICDKYNNGVCKRGDFCTKIHMCCGFLRKCCSDECECGLDHETAMDTDQTQTVLKRFMLNNVAKRNLLKTIFDDKVNIPGKDNPKCHIHQDKPNARICSQFLIGKCNKGLRCKNHHCFLPYHWQYKGYIFDEWQSFSDEDNLTLEKLYCNVNVTQANFKPAQSLDVSHLEREGILPRDREYEVMIDLDNMTISFQKPRDGDVILVGLLRRLSTESYASPPCEPVTTNWKWYWKDNDNFWHLYDKDHWERDLQDLIEQAFLNMLRQDKTRYKFATTSENVYILFFNNKNDENDNNNFWPTREMYQVNLKTGTKRQVKRRPEKPVSKDDLNNLKWACGDIAVNRKTEEKPSKSYIPSHWSPMPSNTQCTRFRLDTSSTEFKDVDQLFRETMKDQAVIESIERVQNPSAWEKYCRNKETLMELTQLYQQQFNEKRLFHGTSPGNVASICENNFDPRFNKRSSFGRGTYFAVNASYSHSYTQRDVDTAHFMFLAKVLVGSYTKGLCTFGRLQPKQPLNPSGDLFDCFVDNTSNPTIFVISGINWFYPEYIIKYLSPEQSQPLRARAPIPIRKKLLLPPALPPKLPPGPLPKPNSPPKPLIRSGISSNLHHFTVSNPFGSALTSSSFLGGASTPSRNDAKIHIHQNKQDGCICSQFLIGQCDKGLRCDKHHCVLPYGWQYKGSIFDEWKSFSEEDNLTLEKLYCDVKVTQVSFKPTQSLDVPHLQREGTLPCDQVYEIRIDLDNMTITFQKPRGGEAILVGLLRRLSTVSYASRPCHPVATNWKWYWKDNDNVWHLYDKDYLGRDLQQPIEEAFLDLFDKGETRVTYTFTTAENVYSLYLCITSKTYQVNLTTETKYEVKRRPEKPLEKIKVSDESDELEYLGKENTCVSNRPRSWYFGRITREESERTLKDHPPGSFLVRDSVKAQKAGAYIISLKHTEKFRHHNIEMLHDGNLVIETHEDKPFPNLELLIKYFIEIQERDIHMQPVFCEEQGRTTS